MKNIVISYLAVLTQICLAQSSSQIVANGYDRLLHAVAPGQVVTFWTFGAKTIFPPGQFLQTADTIPLPTSLAGFSVSFQQAFQALLPIFSIRQDNFCPDQGARPSCIRTGITVQLPMDMGVPSRSCDGPDCTSLGVGIAIVENGTTTDWLPLGPQADSIHILTDCDSLSKTPFYTSICAPKITRADGTFPLSAQVGESLTMYAVGLGVTDPKVPTGTVTPGTAPLVQKPSILYSYFIDPSVPARPAASSTVPPVITYAGLAPGQVGIYQVNFVVPAPPPNAMDCNTGPFAPSNLTVYLVGSSSADSVKICVNLPAKGSSGDVPNSTIKPSPHAPNFRRP